jgi:hypothetical protein
VSARLRALRALLRLRSRFFSQIAHSTLSKLRPCCSTSTHCRGGFPNAWSSQCAAQNARKASRGVSAHHQIVQHIDGIGRFVVEKLENRVQPPAAIASVSISAGI